MPNRLASEKSPYLLQHAANPVDWHPWGSEAFERARRENKPIFLSIGYSTCHWCHVMAHESFESASVAEVLNAHFIPVKVDREERPDVDRVYMTYVQALTGHGGWPLSAWLTPELTPFYGGTYYPPEDRHGRPGFVRLLGSIAHAWATEREKLVAEGRRVVEALQSHRTHEEPAGGQDLTEAAGDAFEKCFQHYYEAFDAGKGGFGGAPKFPRASNLNFLFRVAAIQGMDTEAGTEAVRMATLTLQRMAQGGIHDHVGGGFHRYSVDDGWFVPHFEKMLYDQAQIAVNYLEGYQATGREVFLWQARGILAYVHRDLRAPSGAFYSAEDADSLVEQGGAAHAEGAFYVWSMDQLAEALSGGEVVDGLEIVCHHFGISESGNVPAELDPHGELAGRNILAQRSSLVDTARRFGLGLEEANARLAAALARLKQVRDRRPRPHLDDKIITGWNALMVSALARASLVFGAADGNDAVEAAGYAEAAGRALEFIRRELYDPATRTLYRSWRNGRSEVKAFAEDYAFTVQAALDLYEATFSIEWMQWAEELQQRMDALFWDPANGGYFSSAEGDASIVLRLKDDYDGAEPAASSVAALNLLRLSSVSADPEADTNRALATLGALRAQWTRVPQGLPQALCALECALTPRRQVVLAGDPASPEFRALLRETQRALGPRRSLLAADGGAGQAWLGERAPWLAGIRQRGGKATAYLCEHQTCREPVNTPEALREQLRSG